MTGCCVKTARLDMQLAVKTGEVLRHGRFGLFRDQRATIDFDLAKYSYSSKK